MSEPKSISGLSSTPTTRKGNGERDRMPNDLPGVGRCEHDVLAARMNTRGEQPAHAAPSAGWGHATIETPVEILGEYWGR